MTVDELLVELLRAVYPTYHLEVYQRVNTRDLRYPCIVYRSRDSSNEAELNGPSGLLRTIYEVNIISKNSFDLRNAACTIYGYALFSYLQSQQLLYPGLADIVVDGDEETNEFALEQQEKGYKTATLLVTMTTWGIYDLSVDC